MPNSLKDLFFMKNLLQLRKLFFVLVLLVPTLQAATVRLGVDVLEANAFEKIKGMKVGLVAHPASMNSGFVSTVDVFRRTEECKLVALFGPEHGVHGDEYAGAEVGDRTDPRTGLKIFSLYGKTRKPTPEMLKGLDALVFDLQDIGSRSYTYISTMKGCLEAAAESGIYFVVLDRPNPIGGDRIEGPMLEKGYESFVSGLPVPYVHGMTMGELAHYMRELLVPAYRKLIVVRMSGWERPMLWKDTGLEWIPTSPHIPYASSCAAYATTGIMGELSQVSVGVGYTQPFDLVGAPWIKASALAEALNLHWPNSAAAYKGLTGTKDFEMKVSPAPDGIWFRSARYKPFYSMFKGEGCEGVQIYLNPEKAETLVEINFRILAALNAPKLFKEAQKDNVDMFDKVCGSDEPRKWLAEERDLLPLFEKWKDSSKKFREAREKFLLY
jgi:uncharacterized protein YbbC (DUF1343 family)